MTQYQLSEGVGRRLVELNRIHFYITDLMTIQIIYLELNKINISTFFYRIAELTNDYKEPY